MLSKGVTDIVNGKKCKNGPAISTVTRGKEESFFDLKDFSYGI